jgi:multisubunit Na+/H+ antiporter MnhB subunit
MRVTSPILQTAMRLILPLSLLFAAYSLMKGHNAPGGGFIAGLIAAVAFCTFRMSDGPEALIRALPWHPRVLVFLGLSIALATAFIPLLFGEPFFRSLVTTIHLPFGQELHFASAAVFDIGVFLVVVGVAVGMIQRLSEELE